MMSMSGRGGLGRREDERSFLIYFEGFLIFVRLFE